MPLSFEEIAHWTADDINAQILQALPKGWKFDLQTLPDHWRASYKNENDAEIWAEEHYALRVLLLSAFSWLFQQRNPSQVHPAWRPGPGFKLVPVRRSTEHIPVPDPSDLNPENIRSVYSEHARKRGKD